MSQPVAKELKLFCFLPVHGAQMQQSYVFSPLLFHLVWPLRHTSLRTSVQHDRYFHDFGFVDFERIKRVVMRLLPWHRPTPLLQQQFEVYLSTLPIQTCFASSRIRPMS